MPVKQGGRLVELNPEVVKVFDKYLAEGRRSEPDFTKLINAILEDIIAKEDFLTQYLPDLEVITTKDNSVYIQNKNTRKVFEVTLNDKVRCFEDNSDQCEHARYAMAITEFGKIVRFRRNIEKVMELNNEDKRSRQNQSLENSDSDSIFSLAYSKLTSLVSVSSVPFLTLRHSIQPHGGFLTQIF